jgi:hypothetical protein
MNAVGHQSNLEILAPCGTHRGQSFMISVASRRAVFPEARFATFPPGAHRALRAACLQRLPIDPSAAQKRPGASPRAWLIELNRNTSRWSIVAFADVGTDARSRWVLNGAHR